MSSLARTPVLVVYAFRGLRPVALLVHAVCPSCVCGLSCGADALVVLLSPPPPRFPMFALREVPSRRATCSLWVLRIQTADSDVASTQRVQLQQGVDVYKSTSSASMLKLHVTLQKGLLRTPCFINDYIRSPQRLLTLFMLCPHPHNISLPK